MVFAKYLHTDCGYNHEKEYIEKSLTLGESYPIRSINMGQSNTSVYLEGFKVGFNSVFFDFFEDGQEINIYRDARFNPYMNMKRVRR